MTTLQQPTSLFSDDDIYLFNQGSHCHLYNKFGAHLRTVDGSKGVHFAVWAPNAKRVSLIGDFNDWTKGVHPMQARGSSGVWETFCPAAEKGSRYKYFIESRHNDYRVDKTDPFAFHAEKSPQTASVVCDLDYGWDDREWMDSRADQAFHESPVSIYELHLGSWKPAGNASPGHINYRDIADPLIEHMHRGRFTHVEFLPVMEHPYYGSWGYQLTGYFAPTSRYGSPQDLMYLIDRLHQENIGVILDWVPSHFTSDEHGLAYFDGTHLYEHSDTRKGWHPDWQSCIFNYGRTEVAEFLLNSALFWLDKYHVDGLRVDAVASMLYLDYSRKAGEWIPNQHGGNENLEAIQFLQSANETIYAQYPDTMVIAEESTSWPMVSRPVYLGGLGFGAKWDMGWMNDTLSYLSEDPVHRKYHHGKLTFRMVYAFTENFVLPLSHDEVVHGKGSLIGKMPGDDWQKRAGLRTLYGYQWTQPGKKLLFMGCEFAQRREWNHESFLDWELLQDPGHEGILRWIADLNRAYRREPALHVYDTDPKGFEWVDACDQTQSVVSYLRRGKDECPDILVVLNFTPIPRSEYRLGVPEEGFWEEILNSDAEAYGGSGWGNQGGVVALPEPSHGRPCRLDLTVPPLSALVLKGPEKPE